MEENITEVKSNMFSLKTLLIGIAFGVMAFLIVIAGIHFPIPGTNVVTDPREIFVTFGSAISGPIGALLIGILAGIREPGGIEKASLLAHIIGALWIAFAYKKLLVRYFKGASVFLGWILSVIAYYFVFVITGFALGLKFFHNDPTTFYQLYAGISKGVVFEVILTVIITTLVLVALPKKYRLPLW